MAVNRPRVKAFDETFDAFQKILIYWTRYTVAVPTCQDCLILVWMISLNRDYIYLKRSVISLPRNPPS